MKTWFITGTSKGFGRLWAEAALRRGDTVVATARNIATLASLEKEFGERAICLELDVNDKRAVDAAVETARKRMGSIDVVVNNAGYGLFGMIEELTEAEARAQKRGHILQVSSIGGVNAFSGIGLYNASKWALEGFSQALAAEVKDFGIHVTIIEPTGYPTDWAGASSVQSKQMPEYNPPREWMARLRKSRPAAKVEATSAVVLKLVDMKEPPLRIFFGDGPLDMIKAEYKSRIETWDRFAALTHEANG